MSRIFADVLRHFCRSLLKAEICSCVLENLQEDFGPFSPECVLCYPKLGILYHYLLACFSFPWPCVGFPTVKGPKRLFFLPPTARGHGTGWTRSLPGFVSLSFFTRFSFRFSLHFHVSCVLDCSKKCLAGFAVWRSVLLRSCLSDLFLRRWLP